MGLDMYLNKKFYIGACYEHNNIKGTCEIKKGEKKIPIKLNRIEDISERVGYWRKANQIHNWFVENVQGGKDDCKEYYVDREKLKNLLAICKEILEDNTKAKKLLPTHEGFFFGSTSYDGFYFEDIKSTVEILEPLLEELEAEEKENIFSDIYYRASW